VADTLKKHPVWGVEPRLSDKPKKHPVWGLLALAGFCAFGFIMSLGAVSCGSETMSPGSKCVSYQDGYERTHEESSRDQEAFRTGFGIGAAVLAFASVVLGLRRRPSDPQPDRQAWETVFAQWKAQEIERLLALWPSLNRAELEQAAEERGADYRKKRGWTDSG
jgi:hypothetical protein